MIEAYYRTGPAAQLLGISAYRLRRLCEIGSINAVLTAGRQWQIPESTIRQLQERGIPPIPQGVLGGPEVDPLRRPRMDEPEGQAFTERPPAVAGEVMESANRVEIAKNQLQRRKVELDIEEVEDEFSRRAKEKAEQDEVRMNEEQRRRSEEEALQGRRELMSACLKYALGHLPQEAPPEIRLKLPGLLAEALGDVDLPESVEQTLLLLDAVVQKALQPWRREQDIDRIIQAAVEQLPTQWHKTVTVAAQKHVRELKNDCSLLEVETTVGELVAGVTCAIEHHRMCQRIVSGLRVPGASNDEAAEAGEIASQALTDLPVGTSERQIKAVAEAALGPLRQRIALREDEALREAVIRGASFPWGFPGPEKEEALEAVRRAFDPLPDGTPRQKLEAAREQVLQPFRAADAQRREKERLIQTGLDEMFGYLLRLVREHNLQKYPSTLAAEMKDDIRKELEKSVTGSEGDEAVRQQVRSSIRRLLGLAKK